MSPGRPRKTDRQKITIDIPLKVSVEINDALRQVAQEHGMASAQYVRSLLTIHLNKLRVTDSKPETNP